jgi:hypothetical protein
MKTTNHFFLIVLLSFFFLVQNNYSQNFIHKTVSEIDTLYYLPDSATFLSQYSIALEVFNIHTRFEPPIGWDYYKIKEIDFLFSQMVIGDTLSEVKFYKDTLNTLVYTESVGVVLDTTNVYPNWYKVNLSESFPTISGVIEIPAYVIDLFSLCSTEQTFTSGHTIGFFDGSQSWGTTSDYPIKLVIERDITGIEEENNMINDYVLYQNYPNPFNPATTVEYYLHHTSFVTLKVFDCLGKEVVNLINESQTTGHHKILFDASNLSSGIYFYELKANNFVNTKKLLLVK